MKKQFGKISGAMISLILVIAVIVTVGIVAFGSYVSASNYGVTMETQLKAERENNKNILAQGQQKVLEVVQVPEMYKNDLKEVMTSTITGRYGPNGSQANMQWIKEHAINFDASLYAKVQQVSEAYRDEFKNSQTKMIDVKRSYETNLGFFWKGFWLKLAGFPKINLDEYNPITTDRVEETFKNGKEAGPLKLR